MLVLTLRRLFNSLLLVYALLLHEIQFSGWLFECRTLKNMYRYRKIVSIGDATSVILKNW